MTAKLTIGEVARRAGVSTSAIRYYESVHVLPIPERTSGRRLYQESIVERLAFIQAAQNLGFSLLEIKTLFDELPENDPLAERWDRLARQKLREVKTLIQQAQTMKTMLEKSLHCNCPNLRDCMNCVVANCHSH